MTYAIRLGAFVAVLASVLAVTGDAEAGNRKAFKKLMAQAEAYCEQIKENEVYECSIEKCPCADGLREIKRFDKLRTRPACVCTPAQTGRSHVNEANATDYCVEWNHRNATEGDRCFVITEETCPDGTSRLRTFNRLRGRGPDHLACRGEPPKEEDEESGDGESG